MRERVIRERRGVAWMVGGDGMKLLIAKAELTAEREI